MLRNGRPADDGFKPKHHLYYRFKREDSIGDRLNPNRIAYFDASVNWSKYGKPWDVIFDHLGWGIARFIVRDLPEDLPKETQEGQHAKPHSFFPFHAPLDENYAHVEIGAYKDGVRVKKSSQINDKAKKEFRTAMSDCSLVLRQPEV